MDDKQLIKEKMKEGKRKKKEGNKSYFSFLIVAIINGLSTFIIPSDSKWLTITLLCYLVLTSFIYINVYGAYKITKYMNKNKSTILPNNKKVLYEKGFKYFVYLSAIVTIIIIIIRKLSIWTLLAPIIYCIGSKETLLDDLPPNDSIKKTYDYLYGLKDIEKKAIKMQTKWFIILSVILALIGSLTISGAYGASVANEEKDIYVVIVILSCIIAFILNVIVKLIINIFTKPKERTLNRAFDLNMGEWKDVENKIISETYEPRVLYNYGIMYYKLFVIPFTFITLLFISKFVIGITIIITTIHVLISSLIGYSDSDFHGKGGGFRHTAWIKDSNGNTTGSIEYY